MSLQTPSVQFQLQDYSQPTTVDQVVLQFSNTVNKDSQHIECEDTKQIKKILQFQSTAPVLLQPQLFYQQFQSNFIVQFDNEQLEAKQLQEQSIYPLSQPHAFSNKNISLHLLNFSLTDHIQSSLQEKQIKSEIITKKALPNFQIRHHRKLVKNKQNLIDNKNLPSTCRIFQKKVVYFTSKATPQDAQLAKKAFQKYEKESQRKQNKSLFQLHNKIKQFWASKNPQKLIDSLSSEFKNKFKNERKSNIFQKLPSIK